MKKAPICDIIKLRNKIKHIGGQFHIMIIPQNDTICNLFSGLDWTKIEIAGDLAIKTTTTNTGKKPVCRKISKESYVYLPTGELRQYEFRERESEDDILRTYDSISRTMRELKLKVCANFFGKPNELFVTLTYAEKMTDTTQLKNDFSKFFKRLQYEYKDRYKFDYISVCEPQGSGSWHVHMFLKADKLCPNDMNRLYIDNKKMQEIWGHGYTRTEAITIDGVVNYFNTSYFAPVNCDDAESKGSKKYRRLKYFPKGFRWFRCSAGIRKPDKDVILISEADAMLERMGFVLRKEDSFVIQKENSDHVTTVNRQQWERKK